MRLYFSIEPIEVIGRHRETRLTVANLRLRKKPNAGIYTIHARNTAATTILYYYYLLSSMMRRIYHDDGDDYNDNIGAGDDDLAIT